MVNYNIIKKKKFQRRIKRQSLISILEKNNILFIIFVNFDFKSLNQRKSGNFLGTLRVIFYPLLISNAGV